MTRKQEPYIPPELRRRTHVRTNEDRPIPDRSPRVLQYQVVTEQGPISANEFANATHALMWANSLQLSGFWWVEARIGEE